MVHVHTFVSFPNAPPADGRVFLMTDCHFFTQVYQNPACVKSTTLKRKMLSLCDFFAFPHLFLPSSSFAALSLVPEHAELSPWLSPVLVLPLLQLLSCSTLTEPLSEKRMHQVNLDLAHRLLRQVSKGTHRQQVALRLMLTFVLTALFLFGIFFLFALYTLCKHLELRNGAHFTPNAASLNQI